MKPDLPYLVMRSRKFCLIVWKQSRNVICIILYHWMREILKFTISIDENGAVNINNMAIEGHHMLNVNDNPAFAGDGEVIQFLDKSGHLGAHAIHKYYGSAIDDNSISDEIIAIDRECFSNTGEFLSTNIDEYIFNVSVNNSSISKNVKGK